MGVGADAGSILALDERLGPAQIFWRGHLKCSRVTLNVNDATAGALVKSGIVGELCLGVGIDSSQTLSRKTLRGLRSAQNAAIDGVRNESVF